ncbi:PREDICTED: uncharacterized protein LOC105569293 [Vollenhovia emeryi]|uniref:uncharacterized protein LOC105569293 n=1 Tax=Vollenhovia emeryi TaxID=411798 RepID=UPI0005F42297|nr:PREDICTED: uncharacterized protein LOC105569293 [Vollenhovia emeryi]
MCAKGSLIAWLICCHVGNICDMMWWFYSKDHRYLLIPYIINYYYHVNLFVDILFLIILWYIGTRFDKVNEHLEYQLVKEEYNLICSRRKTIPICTDNYKRVLWTSMHLHLELYQIARQLNIMFGIQITMELVAYLIVMLRLCNYIYIHIHTGGRSITSTFNWICLWYWISVHAAKIIFFNYICETVSDKSSKITVIHRLTELCQYADVHNEIHQFMLQIMQHPLKLTGLGLFCFGDSFLRNLVMTVTTFIIIIMQMSSVPLNKEYNYF